MKKISKSSINYFFVLVMMMGYFLIQVSAPFKQTTFVSIGTWTIACTCFCLFMFNIVTKKIIGKSIGILYCLFVSIFLSYIFYWRLSYSIIVRIICFLEIPIIFCSYPYLNNKKIKQIIFSFHIILALVYIILSFSPMAYLFASEFGITQLKDLTLSYGNPNETSMYLFSSLVVLTANCTELNNKYLKMCVYIVVLFLVYLIYLTHSRTTIFITILFFILCIKFKKKDISLYLIYVAFFIPLVYLFITTFYEDGISNLVFLGETFDTGRSAIFINSFKNLSFKSLFFGNLSINFQNLHNGLISIFLTIGLMGTYWYYNILFNIIRKISHVLLNNQNKFAFIGILCILVHTSTESAFLTGGSAFSVSVLSVFMLSLPNYLDSKFK